VDRKRILRLLSLAALACGLAAAMPLAQRWPKEQAIHYVLGDSATRVTELDARWAEVGASGATAASTEDWAREATFRYESGRAPRVVTHTPRMPDGDYTVEIDVASPGASVTVTRKLTLAGGSTSIDLAHVLDAHDAHDAKGAP
jgi:hypothetical protein